MELYYKNAEHILKVKPFNEFGNITDNIIYQLNDVVTQFTKREIQSKSLHIKTLIEFDVTGNWVDRINKSKTFGRDSSSLNALICRYGEDVGKMLFDEKLKKSTVTEEMYIQKYGDDMGKEKWKELCKSKVSFSEQHFVEKYGESIGKKRWKETLDKKLKSQKENFKNKKWKNGRTLVEYQERYGIEDGYKRWDIRNKRQSYMLSLQRYIDDFGDEKGREICHKIKDNNSITVYIKRYGTELGPERYKLFIEKLLAYNENKPNYSKVSQELFWQIASALPDDKQKNLKFAELNDEQIFYTGTDLKIIQVDFKCNNKIIEFNGDFWHANPNQYTNDDILHHPNNHILAEDLWKKDKQRIEWLESNGYTVLTVWESDYNYNKQEVINKCINFINERS
jgi:hypothetical protein